MRDLHDSDLTKKAVAAVADLRATLPTAYTDFAHMAAQTIELRSQFAAQAAAMAQITAPVHEAMRQSEAIRAAMAPARHAVEIAASLDLGRQASLAKELAASLDLGPHAELGRQATVAFDGSRYRELALQVASSFGVSRALADQMQAVVWKPPEWVSQIQVAATEISRSVQPFLVEAARAFEATRPFLTDVAKAFEAQRPAFEAWRRTMRRTEKIEAAGWLPHYTTPWSELDPVLDDPAAVGEVLERYYSEHWRGVRRKFTNRLRAYDIDDEAKSLFREALSVHRRGHYRSAIRTLFPEMERLVRLELPPVKKGGPDKTLRAAAGDLGVSEIEPGGWYVMPLFEKLEAELYAQVRTDDEVAAAATFSVPARHGTTHGRVVYSGLRLSINALIMADFVFQVISVTKQNRAAAMQAQAA